FWAKVRLLSENSRFVYTKVGGRMPYFFWGVPRICIYRCNGTRGASGFSQYAVLAAIPNGGKLRTKPVMPYDVARKQKIFEYLARPNIVQNKVALSVCRFFRNHNANMRHALIQ